MSLPAVKQMCVVHEAMDGCKKSKDSLKDCFENVNIILYALEAHIVNNVDPDRVWEKTTFA